MHLTIDYMVFGNDASIRSASYRFGLASVTRRFPLDVRVHVVPAKNVNSISSRGTIYDIAYMFISSIVNLVDSSATL